MTGSIRAMCKAAALALVLAVAVAAPAKAQFGGGGGGEDMMTQFAPMLEMMKKKMGKKRFATMMQTMGPMMSNMMEGGGGGLGGMMGGGGFRRPRRRRIQHQQHEHRRRRPRPVLRRWRRRLHGHAGQQRHDRDASVDDEHDQHGRWPQRQAQEARLIFRIMRHDETPARRTGRRSHVRGGGFEETSGLTHPSRRGRPRSRWPSCGAGRR